MKAVKLILAGGLGLAAFAAAAPASAQYYPGYGYGSGNVIGQVLGGVIGNSYGYGQTSPYGGYGYNGYAYGAGRQQVVTQCMGAVQQRLNGSYGGGYASPYGGYGYAGGAAGARVLGVSEIEPRDNGGLTVRGVANSGRSAVGYGGYGYNGQLPVDLTFKCKTDASGYIIDIDIDQAASAYRGYNQSYTPYNYDYSQYGYRRY
jgi:hypothetical protein